MMSSEIDNDVAVGLGAAGQHIAVRRGIDRGWFVAHCPLHETGLTRVANTSSTRPSHGNIARFGKLEQAPKR